ncbi:hypothetical protein ABFV80_000857 [Vandammella animalimorsus]|uniref:hypothetical protein n=1 Tax=Vandammella animalimorsus TaxID=2029117 RepID=UPI00325B67FA
MGESSKVCLCREMQKSKNHRSQTPAQQPGHGKTTIKHDLPQAFAFLISALGLDRRAKGLFTPRQKGAPGLRGEFTEAYRNLQEAARR